MTQDGIQKPEVLAPGNRARLRRLHPNSDFEKHVPQVHDRSHSYFRLSGTSMATVALSQVSPL